MPGALDIANQYTTAQSIAADTYTSTVNGTGVDFNDHGPEVTCTVNVSDVSGTSPTLDVKLQESSDDSTYTDISGATVTQVTASDVDHTITVYNRSARYVRAVGTIAGTSPSFDVGVVLQARKTSY